MFKNKQNNSYWYIFTYFNLSICFLTNLLLISAFFSQFDLTKNF